MVITHIIAKAAGARYPLYLHDNTTGIQAHITVFFFLVFYVIHVWCKKHHTDVNAKERYAFTDRQLATLVCACDVFHATANTQHSQLRVGTQYSRTYVELDTTYPRAAVAHTTREACTCTCELELQNRKVRSLALLCLPCAAHTAPISP